MAVSRAIAVNMAALLGSDRATETGLARVLRESRKSEALRRQAEETRQAETGYVLQQSVGDTRGQKKPLPLSFELFLSQHMLKVACVLGDGSCWFGAVAHLARVFEYVHLSGKSTTELRALFGARFKDYMEKEIDEESYRYTVIFSPFLAENPRLFERKDCDVDMLFCLYLSRVIHQQVVVYYIHEDGAATCIVYDIRNHDDSLVRELTADVMHEWPTEGWIFLYVRKGSNSHYDAILPCRATHVVPRGMLTGNDPFNVCVMWRYMNTRSSYTRMPWNAAAEHVHGDIIPLSYLALLDEKARVRIASRTPSTVHTSSWRWFDVDGEYRSPRILKDIDIFCIYSAGSVPTHIEDIRTNTRADIVCYGDDVWGMVYPESVERCVYDAIFRDMQLNI